MASRLGQSGPGRRVAKGREGGRAWIRKTGERWFDVTRRINAVRPLWVIMWFNLALCALVGLTEPGRDLVSAPFAEPKGQSAGLGFLASIGVFALASWWWARETVFDAFKEPADDWKPPWFWSWLPRLLAFTPFIALALAFQSRNFAPAPWAIVTAIVTAIATSLFVLARRNIKPLSDPARNRKARFLLVVALAVGFLLWLVLLFDPLAIRVAWFIGSPVLAVLGALALLAVVVALYRQLSYPNPLKSLYPQSVQAIGDVRYLPVLMLIGGFALVGQVWNDDHDVVQKAEIAPEKKPDLKFAYGRWQAGLEAAKLPDNTPMIVVSTAGGANRASYWTALVLDALARRSDDPAKFHAAVFAVSGVSGGTLGAAGWLAAGPGQNFGAVASSKADTPGMLDRDLLAPLLAALFFTDIAQRFVPGWLPDRQRRFEQGLETSWSKRCPLCEIQFSANFLKAWPGLRTAAKNSAWRPMLFVNGSRAEDGRRVLTAPVAIRDNVFPDTLDFHDITGRDIPLSTAISNGSRFPIVSPPGRLTDARGDDVGHIVDGGYFENGGVETAVEIIDWVRANDPGRAIVYVEISSDDSERDSARRARPPRDAPWAECERQTIIGVAPVRSVWNEVWLPVTGLYQARAARGWHSAIKSARRYVGAVGVTQVAFQLPLLTYGDALRRPTPLNWTLPMATREAMRHEAGLIARAAQADRLCEAIANSFTCRPPVRPTGATSATVCSAPDGSPQTPADAARTSAPAATSGKALNGGDVEVVDRLRDRSMD